MNVVKMIIQIVLVADNMIPKPVLPDRFAAIFLAIADGISQLEIMDCMRNALRPGINDDMKVVRHNHPCIQFLPMPASPK